MYQNNHSKNNPIERAENMPLGIFFMLKTR